MAGVLVLTVSLPEASGLTLVVFLREDSMNIYTRVDWITWTIRSVSVT